MKILIDIKHPAQLNLFKGLAYELKQSGWNVTVCYLGRGKLPKIIEREYYDFDSIQVGESHGSKWSIFWQGNVLRTIRFFSLIRKNKYNICVAASSAPLAFACYFSKTPIIQFYDDPERKRINSINAFFSNKLFFPPIVKAEGKIAIFNCLKEWSYLSPSKFTANSNVLTEYNLEKYNYIFVREVSNKSFNYYDQQDAIISTFASEIDSNTNVILSLEDKSYAGKYPKNWIILQEPVDDIHSLIYFAKLVLSSGDSMAREGAMLGVPSIYCGIRQMKANEVLIREGALTHLPLKSGLDSINKYADAEFDESHQTNFRKHLESKWDNMLDFMNTQINIYKK
ncbi:DUF354 domain-containing protein [Dyadobacter koreensis]|nr:DUF354 domain-containing protein [Dyadobacter koreensis]